MKKFFVFIFLIVTIISSSNTLVYAKEQEKSPNIIYISEDLYFEISISEDISANTRSVSNTKTASKTYTLKNNDDESLVAFKLTGTFTYNGSSSSCTNVSYSTTIYDSSWKFKAASATISGNTATGEFTATKYFLLFSVQTVSKSLTITCDKNGNLS